jgi:hypothetical protein
VIPDNFSADGKPELGANMFGGEESVVSIFKNCLRNASVCVFNPHYGHFLLIEVKQVKVCFLNIMLSNNVVSNYPENIMPPKNYSFKVKGVLVSEKDNSEDDFSIFITAMDDNHAVMLVREYLRNHAPKGRSIIKGIERKVD